ncbi:MAG: RnfABCDGE type electron transport complex subunit E [Candidatus Auribacterota bacterium]|jgi:electron transport complex protein RnfE|nr:RnfABCDGE type electron transport complex subunit E [Candidatus Auribacterota bacterium]
MKTQFFKGIIQENPIFSLCLGLCPALATSTSVKNAIGMGLSTTAVLIASNMTISLITTTLRAVSGGMFYSKIQNIRIPLYIVVIASFVTMVDFILKGFFPVLSKELGLFVPLIVVNCIILGRAEAFASKRNIVFSLIDAIGMGLGFTLGLFLLGTVRELLGAGQFFGLSVFGKNFKPAIIFILAPGAFLTIGFIMGFFRHVNALRAKKGN